MSEAGVRRRSQWEPVMGTFLQLDLTADDGDAAAHAEATVVDAARQLERSLSRFSADSDLSRWSAGLGVAGAALGPLLARAAWWMAWSEGAFNPFTAELTELWRIAEASGAEPDPVALSRVCADLAVPHFEASPTAPLVDVGADVSILRHADCGALDLHSIAKGWAVDRLVDAAMACNGVSRVIVNAGGDLRHDGEGTMRVGIEDPKAIADNRTPADRIEVSRRAVATSGIARRQFVVGDRRYSRLIDPRTGRPVAEQIAATVVAPDAATADVLATVASVLGPEEFAIKSAGLAVLGIEADWRLIRADGLLFESVGWLALAG